MAELGAAAIGVGATLGAATYTSGKGFVGRHEASHAAQVTEIKQYVADFEAAYARGDVSEDDWQYYLRIRSEANKLELEYEETLEAYKETAMHSFIKKWKKKRRVRKKKNALRKANRKLRSHYSDCSSDASDASSTTAASGSPRGSRKAYDEDDQGILSWASHVRESNESDIVIEDRLFKIISIDPIDPSSEVSDHELTLERRAVTYITRLDNVAADLGQRVHEIIHRLPEGSLSPLSPQRNESDILVQRAPMSRTTCTLDERDGHVELKNILSLSDYTCGFDGTGELFVRATERIVSLKEDITRLEERLRLLQLLEITRSKIDDLVVRGGSRSVVGSDTLELVSSEAEPQSSSQI